MKSALPKVMHTLSGKPLVQHVVDTAKKLDSEHQVHLVVGHGAERVIEHFADSSVSIVEQTEQLGTGHAVAQALPHVGTESVTLVLYGDVPLIQQKSLSDLLALVSDRSMALLTAIPESSSGYGRIVRNAQNQVLAIVEEKDASEEQKAIGEINTGILAVQSSKLHQWLPRLSSNNAQGEYYLTDIIAMAVADGLIVETSQPEYIEETLGVNNRMQLAELERFYQSRQAELLMMNGATLADPARIDVRGELTTGQDCFIDINAIFEGQVILGNNVTIGPNCILKNCIVGDDTVIEAFTSIDDAHISDLCNIGPFARVRPGTKMEQGSKLGNFVETKKAHIGKGSKVNHLTYVGDTVMGEGANIGAGTITCNYDGVNKHLTQIGDGVFVGSNSTLVAPVKLAAGSFIGAGSVITKDTEEDKLSLARAKQVTISKWKRPEKLPKAGGQEQKVIEKEQNTSGSEQT